MISMIVCFRVRFGIDRPAVSSLCWRWRFEGPIYNIFPRTSAWHGVAVADIC